MQALLADVLPWIVAFYVLDALANVRRGQFVLSAPWGGAFRLLRPGLRLLGCAPTAEAIAAVDLPWLAGREALWCFDPRRKLDLATIGEEDLVAVPWPAVKPEASGKAVRDGARTLLVVPHPSQTARLATELARLAADAGRAPEPRAAEPAPAHDTLVLVRRRQRWSRAGLQAAATLLFLWTFVWAPLVAYANALAFTSFDGLTVLAVLLAAELALALVHVRRGGASWGQAAAQAGALVAWPVAALHPLLHLSVHPWCRHGGLVVAAAVLPRDAFRELAAVELARAEVSQAMAKGALAEALALRARSVCGCAVEAGIDAAELRRPPERRDGERAWCPTCRTGFVVETAPCSDCGVPLRSFAA